MLVFLALSAVAYMVEVAFSILPSASTFLPLPPQVASAIGWFASSASYFLYLFGDTIGDAISAAIVLIASVNLVILILEVLLRFRIPVISNVMSMLRARLT